MSMNEDIRSPGRTHRRVLLECDDLAIQDGLERVLHESGYDVSVCAGPASRRAGCALVETGRCGLVDDAEIVVHALAAGEYANREVLTSLVHDHPETPIVLEASLVSGEAPGNVRRVNFPMSRTALLAAIGHEADGATDAAGSRPPPR